MLEKIKNNFIRNKKLYITSALAFVLLINVAHASGGSEALNFDASSLTGAIDGIIAKMGEVLGAIVPKALQIVGVVMIYKFGIKIFHKFSNQA